MGLNIRCECADKGCPVCHGVCWETATVTLYRVDMDDQGGTCMCRGCSDDAMESGLFRQVELVARVGPWVMW